MTCFLFYLQSLPNNGDLAASASYAHNEEVDEGGAHSNPRRYRKKGQKRNKQRQRVNKYQETNAFTSQGVGEEAYGEEEYYDR